MMENLEEKINKLNNDLTNQQRLLNEIEKPLREQGKYIDEMFFKEEMKEFYSEDDQELKQNIQEIKKKAANYLSSDNLVIASYLTDRGAIKFCHDVGEFKVDTDCGNCVKGAQNIRDFNLGVFVEDYNNTRQRHIPWKYLNVARSGVLSRSSVLRNKRSLIKDDETARNFRKTQNLYFREKMKMEFIEKDIKRAEGEQYLAKTLDEKGINYQQLKEQAPDITSFLSDKYLEEGMIPNSYSKKRGVFHAEVDLPEKVAIVLQYTSSATESEDGINSDNEGVTVHSFNKGEVKIDRFDHGKKFNYDFYKPENEFVTAKLKGRIKMGYEVDLINKKGEIKKYHI